jgi:hypothetical protein
MDEKAVKAKVPVIKIEKVTGVVDKPKADYYLKKVEGKALLHIVRCCGKGAYQVIKLQKALEKEGCIYKIFTFNPKKCKNILAKNGLGMEDVRKSPYIYIEDIMIQCEKINDDVYTKSLIEQIKKINGK